MSKTKERIRDSQLRYKQGLGQNFIYDEDLLASLVQAAGITKDDDVLEVGPGAGSMTKHLCKAAHHVMSVELDDRLIPLLNGFMADYDNFTLVHGDVMTVNLPEITASLRKPLSVVANIPYYITTPLMTMLLTSPLDIKQMALMVQKEVGEKMRAKPGQEGYGPFALERVAKCECGSNCRSDGAVASGCFKPGSLGRLLSTAAGTLNSDRISNLSICIAPCSNEWMRVVAVIKNGVDSTSN